MESGVSETSVLLWGGVALFVGVVIFAVRMIMPKSEGATSWSVFQIYLVMSCVLGFCMALITLWPNIPFLLNTFTTTWMFLWIPASVIATFANGRRQWMFALAYSLLSPLIYAGSVLFGGDYSSLIGGPLIFPTYGLLVSTGAAATLYIIKKENDRLKHREIENLPTD